MMQYAHQMPFILNYRKRITDEKTIKVNFFHGGIIPRGRRILSEIFPVPGNVSWVILPSTAQIDFINNFRTP